MMPPLDSTNWRVTIERRDGTFFVRDKYARWAQDAEAQTDADYHTRYEEPCDGESHWFLRCLRIDREDTVTGTPA